MGIIINGQNDTIRATDGTGTVELNVTGNVTGTATTATSSQSVVDSSGNVRISSNDSGMIISGIATVQTGKLMVGNAYIDRTAVGVGQTDTIGRDAGIGTMTGSMIYNTTTNALESYGPEGWLNVKSLQNSGLTATGGIIGDYESNGTKYRTHTFTNTGTFEITELGTYPGSVDYLLVAGGGGGGAQHGGGGGAGGLLSGDTLMGVGSYPVTIGAGGRGCGGNPSPPVFSYIGTNGSSTTWNSLTCVGGGYGGVYQHPIHVQASGGDGGSAGGSSGGESDNQGPSAGNSTAGQGNPGGRGRYAGAGGGGAGASGADVAPASPYTTAYATAGGIGLLSSISGISTHYAGGGGGGTHSPGATVQAGGAGGLGGGGRGGWSNDGPDVRYQGNEGPTDNSTGSTGIENTGGGGGGSSRFQSSGGNGGSGIAILRYVIGTSQTGTAKATGGNINFVNGKTVHTFLTSGTFTMPNAYPSTPVQILAVAGGGAGGNRHGGGGGAGGVVHVPAGTITDGTYAVIVGAGAGAANGSPNVVASNGGNTSFGPSATAAAPTHILALGGGPGGQYDSPWNGVAGGSGGGGAGDNPNKPGGTGTQPNPSVYGSSTGYGNNGGAGQDPGGDTRLSGGGGGAGAVGVDGASGGEGGNGIQIQIAGDSNNNYYWGGGGGGGTWHPSNAPTAGDGGLGGGGGGASNTPGKFGAGGGSAIAPGGAGTAGAPTNIGGHGGNNTGGGGGGNGQAMYTPGPWTPASGGGNGGSGIVIIAYPT